jgi:hypothetical protein
MPHSDRIVLMTLSTFFEYEHPVNSVLSVRHAGISTIQPKRERSPHKKEPRGDPAVPLVIQSKTVDEIARGHHRRGREKSPALVVSDHFKAIALEESFEAETGVPPVVVGFLVEFVPLRSGKKEISTGLEDAANFRGRDLRVFQMLKHLRGEDGIKLGVIEWKGFSPSHHVNIRSGGNIHPHDGIRFKEATVSVVAPTSRVEHSPGHVVTVGAYLLL